MNITSTLITRQAVAETASARYQLEYSVTNSALIRVSASISEPAEGDNPSEIYLGNIYWDSGNVSCSFQMTTKAAKFFEDFEGFMTEIKADAEKLKIK